MPVSCPVTRIGWHLQLRTSEWQLKVWGVDGTLSSLTPINRNRSWGRGCPDREAEETPGVTEDLRWVQELIL